MKTLIQFFIAVVLTAFCLELFLQAASIQTLSIAEYNHEGLMLKKSEPFVFFKEGFSINRTTNHGYLGEDADLSKPAGVIRVALLGDSFTEGLQVFDRDHFRKVMQGYLNANSSYQVEVMNFGRSGFDICDAYTYYKRFVGKFEPDFNLFIIRESDLINNNTKKLTPRCYIDKNSTLAFDNSYLESPHFLRKVETQYRRGISALGDILQKCTKLINDGDWLKVVLGKLYLTNGNDVEKRGLEFKLSNVSKAILKELKEDGAVIVLHDSFRPETLEAVIDLSATVFNLDEPLTELNKRGIDPYYWEASQRYGHWNQDAHLAIGTYLAAQMHEKFFSSVTD